MIRIQDIPDVFQDLTPVPQNDGPDRVCVIQYPSSFTLAYNYMRAVWEAKEFSERSLELSAACLNLNPANYTVWNYRRQCLGSLGLLSDKASVQKDLDLASSLGGCNPKNYQIWYHRRALLESHGPRAFLEEELNYIAEVLNEDAKNYHAWSYRQWILTTVDDESAWQQEMEFVRSMIRKDFRNNSAWNERWLVCHRGKQNGRHTLSLASAREEADFAIDEGARIDPYNESPWRYLIGILKEQQRQDKNEEIKEVLVEYESKASKLRAVLTNAGRDPDACVNMISARIDLLDMIGTKESLNGAIALAEGLHGKYDTVRKKYWSLVIKRLQSKIENQSGDLGQKIAT